MTGMVTKSCAAGAPCVTPTPCPAYGPDEPFNGTGTAATLPSIYGPWIGDTGTVDIAGGQACSSTGPRGGATRRFSAIYVNDPCNDYCAHATAVDPGTPSNGFAGLWFNACVCPPASAQNSSGYKFDWTTGGYTIFFQDCAGVFTLIDILIIGGPEPTPDVFEIAKCGNDIVASVDGVVTFTNTLTFNLACTGRGVVTCSPLVPIVGTCVDDFSYTNNCGTIGGCCP